MTQELRSCRGERTRCADNRGVTVIGVLGRVLVMMALCLLPRPVLARSSSLVVNGCFEADINVGWQPVWSRDSMTTACERVPSAQDRGFAVQITATGHRDWSLAQAEPVTVTEGDIYALSCRIEAEKVGTFAGCQILAEDARGQILDWNYSHCRTSGTHDWAFFSTRFVVPHECVAIRLYLTGWGAGTARFDDVSLVREGTAADIMAAPQDLIVQNASVRVVFHTQTSTMTIADSRNDHCYRQLPLPKLPVVRSASVARDGRSLSALLWDAATGLDLGLALYLPNDHAEVTCELTASGQMSQPIEFPAPFAAGPGDFLAIPLNEGALYPADDATVEPLALKAYEGAMMSMPWFGQVHGERGPGIMTLLVTRDDAGIEMNRPRASGNTHLCVWPTWQPSMGEFRYTRKVQYYLTVGGGYTAHAKYYRDYARRQGLLISLSDKRRRNPSVDTLLGAPHVWARVSDGWNDGTPDHDPLRLISEMKDLGIQRILYNGDASPAQVRATNRTWPDVITSRYNNVQDTWEPGRPATAPYDGGYPHDIVRDPRGEMRGGWPWPENGVTYRGFYICSSRMVNHAEEQMLQEQQCSPFRGRFVDTTTATEWLECYHPAHPQSRSDDGASRNRLLDFVSGRGAGKLNLIAGSETGIDATVPYAHYFEGMLSLHAYMLPPSEDLGAVGSYMPPTPDFLKYNIGPYYRVPLFELVFHDCVQSTWWWGDSTGRLPEVWPQRDLINALYGTNPLFYLTSTGPNSWEQCKHRYAQTYQAVCTWVHAVGYDEMLDHEFLSPDHTLQKTTWSSGKACVANWAAYPQAHAGHTIPALSFVTY